jgi:hypothetical protein
MELFYDIYQHQTLNLFLCYLLTTNFAVLNTYIYVTVSSIYIEMKLSASVA